MRHVRTTRRRAALRLLLLSVCLAAACGAALLPSSPAGGLAPGASAATSPAVAVAGWTRTGPYTGVVSAVAASRVGPAVVYAYLDANGRDGNDQSRNGLFKSTDAGATWVRTAFPSQSVLNSVLSLAVDPTDSAIVYAGTFRNGVFKSTDGGATWAGPFLPPDRDVIALAVDPFATNVVYASLGGHGVFKSTNGGATWASTQNGINFFGIISIVIDHTTPGVVYAAGGPGGQGQFAGVYKSTNGGASWTRLTGNLQPSFTSTNELVMDPANSSTLYLATGVGVFKSTDGGATWGASGAGLPAGARVTDLAVSPTDSSVILAASLDFRGVYRSADAGATWNPAGGSERASFNDLAFDAAGADAFGGSIGAGMYRGAAGGAAWGQTSEGFPFALVTVLAPDPNNHAAVYAGTVEGIHRGTDGGATWETAGFGGALAQTVRGLVFDPSRPLTLYAAIDLSGVSKTTDGGATWASIFGTFNRNVNFIAIDPSNPQTLFFAHSFSRMQRTTDGGATWTQVGPPDDFNALAVAPTDSAIVYAVGGFGVYKSTNGGTTFTRLSVTFAGLNSAVGVTIDQSDANTVYVYGVGPSVPVYKTTDGGATWSPAANGLPPTANGAHSLLSLVTDPLNPAVLYAACNGPASAGGGVYRSADRGANWSLHETPLDSVNAVAVSPSGRIVYAGTEHGVFTSQTPPAAFAFAADNFTTSEGAGAATVTVTRADATAAASVVFSTSGGSARAGQDYAAVSETLTFAPGETTKSINVNLLDDALDEFDEGVVLNLRATGGAPSLLARASLLIADDDPLAALSVGDVSVVEGDFEDTSVVFPVTLSAPSEKTVTVGLSLASGTAFVLGDLLNLTGPFTLTFAPGETLKQVSVTVRGDVAVEQDETFFLDLAGPVNATAADPRGQGTIINDDAAPTVAVSINDASVIEGNHGTTEAFFTATLSAPSARTAKVDFSSGPAFGTITFAPGETVKTFAVPVFGNTRFSGNVQREVQLSNPRNLLLGDDRGIMTIINDDRPPVLVVGDLTVREGDTGSREIFFPVTLSAGHELQVAFSYQVVAGTAGAGEDYTSVSGRVAISPANTVTGVAVTIRGDTLAEGDETFTLKISDASNGVVIADDEGRCVLVNDDGAVAPSFRWSAAEYKVSEGARQLAAEVVRAGDLSAPAEVRYETGPGATARPASERSDYTTALGTLRFAPGEERKTVNLLITDDTFAEHAGPDFDESLTLTLRDPSAGVALAEPHTAVVNIIENDLLTAASNPIDDTTFFVRQHYHDFLGREPDQAGLDFWSGGINSCGTDLQCREVRRINTSAAFFLSIEFQRTGYQVIRFHQASFAETPQRPRALPRYRELLAHSQELGRGVVVGVGEWEQQLRDNTLAFARRWVEGAEFVAAFPQTMTAPEFVDKLFANTGATPTQAERDAALAAFGAGDTDGRARALLSVSDSSSVNDKLKSPAFVLMQYVGYLRRSPDDPQDTNFDGYDFWLTKLNQFGGNYEQAEMVKAFITSIEYRRRFGN